MQQARDLALAVEDALALHFGRVRGQHRATPARRRTTPPIAAPSMPCARDALERVGELPALRRRAGERVRAAAAVLVHVLGDVGEVREVAERADDVERLRDRQVVEQRDSSRGPRPRRRGSARRKRTAVWRIASMRA